MAAVTLVTVVTLRLGCPVTVTVKGCMWKAAVLPAG